MRIEYNPMFTLIKQRHLSIGQVARIYASYKANDDSYRPTLTVLVRLCKCLHCHRIDELIKLVEVKLP